MEKSLNEIQRKLTLDKITFFSICSSSDREKILGLRPMTFEDFRRISLIADYLSLDSLHQYMWYRFYEQFADKLDKLLLKCKKHDNALPEELKEAGRWLHDFEVHAPNATVAGLLHEVFSKGLDND